jgi:putative transposase
MFPHLNPLGIIAADFSRWRSSKHFWNTTRNKPGGYKRLGRRRVTGYDFSHTVPGIISSALAPASMARPSRNADFSSVRSPVRTFFVSSRTSKGRALLQTESMANLFIDVLRSYMRAKRFTVHEFVVMPDHIHVLLSLGPEMSIEKAVQMIKGNFSYRARKELGYKWEIWQKGFSEVQILTEASFIHHQNYIDENPVRAGLARSAEEYPYCSTYLKKKKAAAKAGK